MNPLRSQPFRSIVAWICFLGVAGLGVAADLTTKSLAVIHLKNAPPFRVIPHLLQFEYTQNYGAVFGMGQGQAPLFITVSVAAILFLVYLFSTSGRSRLYQIILGLLLAGVIGNMFDRLSLGYVRDMIHGLPGVDWPGWVVRMLPAHWQPLPGERLEVFPWIFNIADSMLCVGVGLMIVYSFISDMRRHRAERDAPVADNKSSTDARQRIS